MKTNTIQNKTFRNLLNSTLFAMTAFLTTTATAQDTRPLPQITVSGEGKVKVAPDQVKMLVSVETKGNNAIDVKKQNDAAVEKVIQLIRKQNLPKEDVQTQRVVLNPHYDYDKKKYNFIATQTIEILLKDLSKYDVLMSGLVDSGINQINSVEFQSSKLASHQAEARKLAIKEAKAKAEDYVGVLGQKVGKAYMINDNTQMYYPQPLYMASAKAEMADQSAPRETLAIGEITITANVTASFLLE